jgi:hypothetical protein
VGMLVGFWLSGNVFNYFAVEGGGHNWKMIWIVPATIALLVMLSFGFLFKNEKIASS